MNRGLLERLFDLRGRGTNVRTELVAGVTTFVTMAYILFVNVRFLGEDGAGMPDEAVFFATAVAAGVVSLAMGLFVNVPVALAPGMGLNAYFMSVVLGSGGTITWQIALGAVFVSGLLFVLLTVTRVRQTMVAAVPPSLRAGITVGIGLFIATIGLKMSGLMTISVPPGHAVDPAKGGVLAGDAFLPALGDFIHRRDAQLALVTLAVIAVLMALRVRGALLIGIAVGTLVGVPMGVTDFSALGSAGWLPDFDRLAVGALDVKGALAVGLIDIILLFTFVELFDSFGTLVGTLNRAGLLKDRKQGERTVGRAMLVDAAGVSAGALLGTSTVTAYIESASGIAAGGRTGLTAVTTGVLFLAALWLAPLALVVPSAVTAPALIAVGVLMAAQVREIEWDDVVEAFPAFLTIVLMPLTYSIANGICAGIVAYTLLGTARAWLVRDRKAAVHWILWVFTALIVFRYVWLGLGE